jgi:peroxisomal 2,4-dienoyl-CoA reductase
MVAVDGGAWHTHGAEAGSDFAYPDFLLSDEVVSGVKGIRKSKM